MLKIPGAPSLSVAGASIGIAVPGALMLGDRQPAATHYIFLQNDSDNKPASIWYVQKVTNNRYEMLNATAPRGTLYIGAFNWDIETNKAQGRLDSTAQWTTSDASIVKIASVSASAQATVTILKAGTAVLTCCWNGLVSTLTITAS